MTWKEKAKELDAEKRRKLQKIHRRLQRRMAEANRKAGMSKSLLPDRFSNVHRVSSTVIRRRGPK